MTTIHVTPANDAGTRFSVDVRGADGSATVHEVTVSDGEWERFGAGYRDRSDLAEASFRFLLDREPKESILRSFELGVIAQYFPEYGQTISKGSSP